jgi:predicted PurR-regulated permease PerM
VKKTNSIVGIVFLVALLVATLGVVFWLFRSFLEPFAFASVIGVGFYPLYLCIRRFVRGPNQSALLSTFAVLLAFVLPAFFIASAASAELNKAAHYLGDRGLQEGGALDYLTRQQQKVLGWLGKYVDVEQLNLEDAIARLPGHVSRILLAVGTRLVGGVARLTGDANLTFRIFFFLFRDGKGAAQKVI